MAEAPRSGWAPDWLLVGSVVAFVYESGFGREQVVDQRLVVGVLKSRLDLTMPDGTSPSTFRAKHIQPATGRNQVLEVREPSGRFDAHRYWIAPADHPWVQDVAALQDVRRRRRGIVNFVEQHLAKAKSLDEAESMVSSLRARVERLEASINHAKGRGLT